MNNLFKNANWIWYTNAPLPDSYGDFIDTFYYNSGKVKLHISCDGDYTLFVNKKFVNANQYGDFEHYKIYDSIDITDYLVKGKNDVYILVWHLGINTSKYKLAPAGLIYTAECDGEEIINSSAKTLSRENPNYKSNYKKLITIQLGQSFLFDATKKDDADFKNSIVVNKICKMFPRPIKKAVFLKEKEIEILKNESNHYLIDLGEEVVGVPVLRFETKTSQKIVVAWGEHIVDGKVRKKIGGRDFTFEYIAKAGKNIFNNYMLRLGCRYLEIFSVDPIGLEYAGIIPQIYPVEVIDKTFENPLDKNIYDACVNTLKLCMMEHYVDTPWREQSLYVFDSKNQMLSGYKAFKNQNKEYARANLLLISKDDREDGILSITYPSGGNLAIPSFSLYYFLAVDEYITSTGDLSLGIDVYEKLNSVLKKFLSTISNGLVKNFVGEDYWHFYDWSDYMASLIGEKGAETDLMINCLMILALESFKNISKKLGKPFEHQKTVDELKENTKSIFYCKEKGLFSMLPNTNQFTELGNAMAILAKIPSKNECELIAEKLALKELNECSLSMKYFKYEALLKVNKKHHKTIIDEIHKIYTPMLDAGSKSVWEVAEGEKAFDNAGSLSHGWSAIPIIYL